MSKMMKQMGMNMDELDAEKVEVHLSNDKKLVFSNPDISKIKAKAKKSSNYKATTTKKPAYPKKTSN